jgi:putative ABC transport system permease protein
MSLRQDVTYAVRLLWRSPLFTLTAVLSLAIGIAGNAVVFSVADALFLRARPGIAEPERLVDIGSADGFDNMSYPNVADLRARNTVFEDIAAYRDRPQPMALGSGANVERVFAGWVGGNYFDVLGARMTLGRGFTAAEDNPSGGSAVVVLSHDMWQRRLGGDPGIAGRTITLNRLPYVVVGVAPPEFAGNSLATNDLWLPLSAPEAQRIELFTMRQGVWLQAIGRLKPDASLAQARAQAGQIARDLEREFPDTNEGFAFGMRPSARVSGDIEGTVLSFVGLLFAMVTLILLIACTNVGSMLLARGTQRTREIATRLALGAARTRVIRQLVTESLLIAASGAALGIAGSLLLVRLARTAAPALPFPIGVNFAVDWRVVVFSVALAVIAGLLAGLLPAIQATRAALAATMKWESSNRSRSRLRQTFVVAQIAMSMLLVVCALLLGRALATAYRIDPGFATNNVDALQLDFRLGGYDDASGQRFAEDLLARASSLPGIESIATSRMLPLGGAGLGLGPLFPADRPREDQNRLTPLDWNVVSPDYFSTVGTRILRGRPFDASDTAASTRVAIVSEMLASRAWPGQDPIGQRLTQLGFTPERGEFINELLVVGVAQDVRFRAVDTPPRAFVYVAATQEPGSQVYLLARTNGPSAIPALRALVTSIDPNVPVIEATTLDAVAANGLAPNRIAAILAGGLGVVGIFLAALGIYGVTAFSVSQRTREIGVRVALGAVSGDVFRLVVSGGMRLALIGIVIGAAAAAAASQLLTGMLYGVPPIDPLAFVGGSALFATAALLASLFPARRAIGLNPVDALRAE